MSYLYSKKINGTYYTAVAAAENNYKKLWVVTSYISKNKEDITQVLHGEISALGTTSETPLASLSSNQTISQNNGVVNAIKYLTNNDYDDYIKSGNQHTQHKKSDIAQSGESAILRSKEETDAFIERSLADSDFHSIRAFSKATDRMVRDIAEKGNIDVDGYYLELNSSDILHTAKHENELREHQIPLTEDDLKRLPEYMVNYDDVLEVKKQKDGSVKVWLGKKINGHSIVITIASKGRQSISLKTAYLIDTTKYDELFGTKKEEASHREATASNIDTTPVTSENVPSTKSSSTNNIARKKSNVNDEISKNNGLVSVKEVKQATGFGDSGAELVINIADSGGMTLSQAEKAVKNAYLAGFAGVDSKKVNFETETQIDAFTAGKKDRLMQDITAKENAKTATVYDSGFTENEHSKKLSSAEREIISTIAKDFGMSVEVIDEIVASVVNGVPYEANARHVDGKMDISSTANKVIYSLVLHEGGHRMKQLAPIEFGVLMDALVARAEQTERSAKLGVSQTASFDEVKAQHDEAGITMGTLDYFEEIAVRELETIFSSSRDFNKWYEEMSGNRQVRTAWEKFVNWIYEIIDDIKSALKQTTMTKEERTAYRETLAELEHIKELLADTYKASKKAVAEIRANKQGADVKVQNNTDIKVGANFDLKKLDQDEQKSIEANKNVESNGEIVYNEIENNSLYTNEVMFSSRYNVIAQSQSIRKLYDSAKKGNVESAYDLISQLLEEDVINKIKNLGNDVCLLPVIGAEGTSSNVLPRIIAKHISVETGQDVFDGIYKEYSSNSREKTVWGRMKETYPSFVLDEKDNIKKSHIVSKKFILIDDNSTTGRTFVGLENFLEENGGKVVGYYALTTGQDQSEKMITTDETWNKLLNLGLNKVKDFAEKEGIKREISKLGLTERETQELIKQFRRKKADSRRGVKNDTRSESGGGEIRTIYETEKKGGSTEKSNGVKYSLKEKTSINLENEENADNNNTKYLVKDNVRTKIKYSSTGIKLPSNEYAKFRQSTSTDYYKSYKTHKGLQYQSCVTDDTHILYVYEDGGFDIYKPVARIDYANIDVANAIIKEIENGTTHRITDLVNRVLQTFEIRRGGYTVYNAYTKKRSSSRGDGSLLARTSESHAGGIDGSGSRSTGGKRGVGVDGITDARLKEDGSYSLKGYETPSKRKTEFLDVVEDMINGIKGATDRLSDYVDSGMISADDYEELIEKYGAIPRGEKPHRDIQVPRKTAKDKKVSQTVRTILEARATPDEAVPTIEKMVEDGVFSYDAYTDKQAINDAQSYIQEYGWEESLKDWFDSVEKGEVSKRITAMGWALYNNAANTAASTTSETEKVTAVKTSLNILDAMVRHQRSAAQALQATRILKNLSPETQLYGVQKSVQALQRELSEKYGDKAPNLKIDENLQMPSQFVIWMCCHGVLNTMESE